MHCNPVVASARSLATRAYMFLSALLVLGILSACGGGGGGGGATAGGGSGPVLYTGNNNAAVIGTANAADITAGVLGSGDTATAFTSAAPAPSGGPSARELALRLGRGVPGMVVRSAINQRQGVLAIQVDDPLDCVTGSGRITGTLNDNGTGTVAVTWSNCFSDGSTLNGSGSVTISAPLTGILLDFTFNVTRVTVTTPTGSGDLSGAIRLQVDRGTGLTTVTSNWVARTSTGALGKVENLVISVSPNNPVTPTSFTERINGRIYDGVQGFVDIRTDVPLAFDSPTQAFPRSGQITLTGSNNAHLRIIAFSASAVTLGLDLDGDGVFERAASLAWTELRTPVAADLRDDDGDGMHNSWEDAHNLNRANPADALEDPDGDSFSNLAEYRAASDPRNGSTTPLVLPAPFQITFPALLVMPAAPAASPLPEPAAEVAPPPPPIAGRRVDLPGVSDLVFDASSGKLYAAVLGAPAAAGSVVRIIPTTGVSEATIQVGNDPTKLALSADGQFLYVGLKSQPGFQRIRLATGTVETFSLGITQACGSMFVEDMQVLPGSPGSVAISRRNGFCSPRHEGVAIYDHGIQRVARTDSHTGSNIIQFASGSTLYGYNSESTEFGLRTMTVDSLGVAVTRVNNFGFDLVGIRFGGGLLYTRSGHAIDPAVPVLRAKYAVSAIGGTLVLPDTPRDRVYYLSFDSGTLWNLRAFNTAIPPVRQGRIDISNVVGQPSGLIRWGASGLAFHTGGIGVNQGTEQVIFIDSAP